MGGAKAWGWDDCLLSKRGVQAKPSEGRGGLLCRSERGLCHGGAWWCGSHYVAAGRPRDGVAVQTDGAHTWGSLREPTATRATQARGRETRGRNVSLEGREGGLG